MKIKSLFKFFSSKGFTLIELLIVIAILGVLAAGILVAIDPVDKINAANDSKVQNDVSATGRASEAYVVTHNGLYPFALVNLETSGELKKVPTAPSGYTAYAAVVPATCTAENDVDCISIVITGQLKAKRYTSVGTPVWRYESSTGKSCAVATTTTACP